MRRNLVFITLSSLHLGSKHSIPYISKTENVLKHRSYFSELFLFIFVVVQKVTILAILHDDFQLLIFLIEVRVVDLDEVRVNKFFHDFNLFESLIAFEGVYSDSFQSKRSLFAIFNKIDTSETSLPDGFNHVVLQNQKKDLLLSNYNVDSESEVT